MNCAKKDFKKEEKHSWITFKLGQGTAGLKGAALEAKKRFQSSSVVGPWLNKSVGLGWMYGWMILMTMMIDRQTDGQLWFSVTT